MLSDQSFYPIMQYKILAAVTQPPILRPVRSKALNRTHTVRVLLVHYPYVLVSAV